MGNVFFLPAPIVHIYYFRATGHDRASLWHSFHNEVTCSGEVQLFPSPSFLIHRLVVGVGFFYLLFILQAPFGHIDASSELCVPGNYGSRDSANLHSSQSFWKLLLLNAMHLAHTPLFSLSASFSPSLSLSPLPSSFSPSLPLLPPFPPLSCPLTPSSSCRPFSLPPLCPSLSFSLFLT